MKAYRTTFVFALIMFIGELHTYFSSTHTSNWIINSYRPMPDAWNMKYVGLQFIYILYPLTALWWVNNRVNRTTAISFISLAVMDTMLYFWNYKQGVYGPVYFWYVALWLIIYFSHRTKTKQ